MINDRFLTYKSSLFIEELYWKVIDWLYPPLCIGCRKIGEYLCTACFDDIEIIRQNQCVVCGSISRTTEEACECTRDVPGNLVLRSWSVYRGIIRKAIHQMKFEGDKGLIHHFSRLIGLEIMQMNWSIDCVLPVPLSQQRKKERGFNQAALMAQPIAQMLELPHSSSLLHRPRDTLSQVGLNAEERKKNVANAFTATAGIEGKNVLILDDLATTCSTIIACADALIQAGVNRIYAYTLARTKLN